MPRHSQKWYDAVKKANAKRRGSKASAKTRRKLSKARKKMWRNRKFRKRTLRSRRLALLRPEVQEHRKQAALASWQGVSGRARRQSASKRMRCRMKQMSNSDRAELMRTAGKASAARMTELWQDPVWRAKELTRRAMVYLRDDVKKRRSAATKRLWADPKWRARTMKTRKRTMYSNPKWIDRAPRAGAVAVRKKFGGHSWNAGQTKDTHPALREISERFKGRIPDTVPKVVYHGLTKHIVMRSRFETAFARWCDERGIEWRYEPRWFNVGKGAWRGTSYTPDFYLPHLDAYVELKGYFSKANQAKMQAFYKQYPEVNFYLLGVKALRALRVLLDHIPRRKPIFQHVKGSLAA